MKQKNDDNEVVTKGYLRHELSILRTEFDKLRIEVDEKAKTYRDQILTRLDEIMGEFENIREDRTLAVGQTRDLRDQVEDHERRIGKMERAQKAA